MELVIIISSDSVMFTLYQKWRNAGLHENLHIPDKNEFIPTNFDLMTRDEDVRTIDKFIIILFYEYSIN